MACINHVNDKPINDSRIGGDNDPSHSSGVLTRLVKTTSGRLGFSNAPNRFFEITPDELPKESVHSVSLYSKFSGGDMSTCSWVVPISGNTRVIPVTVGSTFSEYSAYQLFIPTRNLPTTTYTPGFRLNTVFYFLNGRTELLEIVFSIPIPSYLDHFNSGITSVDDYCVIQGTGTFQYFVAHPLEANPVSPIEVTFPSSVEGWHAATQESELSYISYPKVRCPYTINASSAPITIYTDFIEPWYFH